MDDFLSKIEKEENHIKGQKMAGRVELKGQIGTKLHVFQNVVSVKNAISIVIVVICVTNSV